MAGDFGAVPALQKFYQQVPGHIHLRGKADRVTSIVLPLGLAAAGAVLLGRGLFKLYTGTGKLE